jgi:hypothetical protein
MISTSSDNSTSHSCSFSAFIQNRRSGKLAYVRLDCMSWGCCKCSLKLKKVWGNHIAALFDSESSGLWRIQIEPGRWSAVYSQIRRLGGNHVRIRSRSGYTVYSNVPIQEAESFCRHDAAAIARRDIASIPPGRRGISTCHRWKLKSTHESTHRLISKTQANEYAVKRTAEEVGVAVREWKPPGHSNISRALEIETSGWPEERLLNFIERANALSAPRWCQDYPNTGLGVNSINSDKPPGARKAIGHPEVIHPLIS